MTTIINAVASTGLTQTADGSGIIKVQSNGVTTNALAWVYYNAATQTIVSSYNISSVTYVGTGEFIFNFTNTMSNANYVVVGNAMQSSSGNGYTFFPNAKVASPYYLAPTTSAFGAVTSLTYNTSLHANCEYTYAAVFGQ